MTLKTCTRCGATKDANEDFYWRKPRGNYARPNSWCKECDKQNVRARRHKAIAALRILEAEGRAQGI